MNYERLHIDLYTGLAGFSLAAAANGVRTVVQCEKEEFLAQALERIWRVPCVRDVRRFNGKVCRGAWVLTAGTPCQPASRAGKQKGAADNRWLWDETLRVLEEAQPTWFLGENPPGIDDVGLGGIIANVEGLGYEVEPLFRIPACAVNSPQDRDRFWIVAHRIGGEAGWEREQAKDAVKEIPVAKSKPREFPHSQTSRIEQTGIITARPVSRRRSAKNGSDQSTQSQLLADSKEQLRTGRERETLERGRTAKESLAGGAKPGLQECSRERSDAPEEQPAIERGSTDGSLADGKEHAIWAGLCAPGSDGAWRRLSQSAWQDYEWIEFDGKVFRAPTGLHSLADGVSARVPRRFRTKLIAALGNAICWPIAAEIIGAMIQVEK